LADHHQAAGHDKTRRRTLLVALLGAGSLGQRAIPGKWAKPVVDSVLLPAHAATSEVFVTGNFGSGTQLSSADFPSLENIAERTEEEILDLFVNAAEANGCSTNSCSTGGTAKVEVVATVTQNPSSVECLKAKVVLPEASSCSYKCLVFDFSPVSVNGSTVSVPQDCELKLTGVTLSAAGLSGSWSYSTAGLSDNGTFLSPADENGGCDSLTPCPM
jgi:hypothetical protein